MASTRFHARIRSGKQRLEKIQPTAVGFTEHGEALRVTFARSNVFGDLAAKPEIELTMNEEAALELCARILLKFNYSTFYPNSVPGAMES